MKIRTKVKFLAFAIVMIAVSTSLAAQKKVDLSYNLDKGDSYIFNTNVEMDMTFEAMGTTATLDQVMTMQMTSVVTDSDKNEIKQDITIDKITMNQKIFGMEMNYDSEDPSTYSSGMGAQLGEQMNKVIGSTIKSTMDIRGNIIDMDMSSVTDNEDIANNLGSGNTFVVYADREVAVGESWETDVKPLEGRCNGFEVEAGAVSALTDVDFIVHARTEVSGEVLQHAIQLLLGVLNGGLLPEKLVRIQFNLLQRLFVRFDTL